MFAKNVPFEEFERRREKCREEVVKQGLNGVMIWSRGGGTWDRFAGVDYFANHYQQRCYLPDQPPLWTGRSHCVLMIPKEGEPVLIVTTLEYRKDLVAVKDIRYSTDFFKLVADTAKELKMDIGKVGVMYEDTLTWKIGREMKERMPELELVPCDDILSKMRLVKSPREIESIRRANEIGTEAVEMIMNNVAAGKTEAEVIGPAMAKVYSEGAVLYFIVTSSGPHSDAVHSVDFPGYDCNRKLQDGELFKVDFIICYEGYICDFGRTTVVGGKPTEKQKRAIDIVTDACEYVMSLVKPGVSVRELCEAGDRYLEERGVSLSSEQTDENTLYAAFPPHWGHGIGLTWERPWFIHEEDMILEENMYIAIEKGLYQPGLGTVNYEQNLIVTKDGSETLSKTKTKFI
ncbi:MAG: Xaa-Pro peptidase family protein [Fusobacterium perfoetens]|uniref:M24 family metallopeptidase n=1 Tax=Fusobacterium perfoetens TaxID=852 RepID=UPI0023F058EE|nr:Xaa-Pro peptidase family protein [Fusobacterium perfoetens]MCI6152614.1 Xaa-Pro peptidase family protein [Fusobacterium perfoetens]MDY3237621.1 Xaa-Pro peptidase family protein [Fusobacterium perfoetens]